jgi:hypothetical protein
MPSCHDVVAARFGVLRAHPEPYGGLEGQHRVLCDQVRVVEAIKAQRLTSLDVVVTVGRGGGLGGGGGGGRE